MEKLSQSGSDEQVNDWHIGRGWFAPDPYAPGCGCEMLPCGLVSSRAASYTRCDQHGWRSGKTIRTSHLSGNCPVLEGVGND